MSCECSKGVLSDSRQEEQGDLHGRVVFFCVLVSLSLVEGSFRVVTSCRGCVEVNWTSESQQWGEIKKEEKKRRKQTIPEY